jgi:hypothetical protein
MNSPGVNSGGELLARVNMKNCATESSSYTLNNGTLDGMRRNH